MGTDFDMDLDLTNKLEPERREFESLRAHHSLQEK
jgi:hypothetical protein